MTEGHDQELPELANLVGGDASGSVVQAGKIEGGVHYHDHHNEPSRKPRPAQLPPDVPDFVGRHDELMNILHVATHRDRANAVVLSGQPGAGKTSLAVHFAHRHRAKFPDGQVYLEMHGVHGNPAAPSAIVERLLRALGVHDDDINGDADAQQDLYRTVCQDKKILVILDNAGEECQVRPLIASGPHCLTLITSRNNLSGLDGVCRVPVGTLSPRTALDMLAEIISAERVAAQYPSAEAICRMCGFLPLALRIAGNLAVKRRGWSLDDLARRLSDERLRLDQLKAGDIAVRASFQLSYDRLDPSTQSIFQRIPSVPGPDFNIALLNHAIKSELRTQLDDELELLADFNLISYSGRDGRYKIHDLLRLFAEENLYRNDTIETAEEARGAVIGHLLKTAASSSAALLPGTHLYQPGEPLRLALSWLDDNISNVLAAHELAVKRKNYQVAIGCAPMLIEYLRRRNMWTAERHIVECTLDLLKELRQLPGCRHHEADQFELVMLQALCEVWVKSRNYRRALDTCDRIDALAERATVDLATAVSLNHRGKICEAQKMYTDALKYYQRALQVYQEKGQPEREGLLQHNIGNILSRLGKSREGLTFLHRDLDECRRRGDIQGEAHTLNTIGLAQSRSGDNTQAERTLAEAIKKFQECHDIRQEANAQNDRGAILRILGRPSEALECHRRDLAVCHELDDRRGTALAHCHIANCLIELSANNANEAIGHANSALNQAEPQIDFDVLAYAYLALGDINNATGKPNDALGHYTEAAMLAEKARDYPAQALALRRGAGALIKQGLYNQAIHELVAALDIYKSFNLLGDQEVTLLMLAEAAGKAGDLDQARRHIASAQQINLEFESFNNQDSIDDKSTTRP